MATASGGTRKSQAETPAARVATSSWLRDSRTKQKTPPSRTANGSSFCPRSGSCSSAMPMITAVATPCPAVRLMRSTMSIEKASSRKRAIDHPHAEQELARQIAVERPGPAHEAASGAVLAQRAWDKPPAEHGQRGGRAEQGDQIEQHAKRGVACGQRPATP